MDWNITTSARLPKLFKIPTPLVGINGLKQTLIVFFNGSYVIPTPLVGINGLKQNKAKAVLFTKYHSNASCRYKWIETLNWYTPYQHQYEIPTPLVGINGLKLIGSFTNQIVKEHSNASCRYKWIETGFWIYYLFWWVYSNASCRYKWIETS